MKLQEFIWILATLLIISISTHAQVLDTFDFNNYKEFNYEYETFTIFPDFSGSVRSRLNSDFKSFSTRLNPSYFKVKNTRKIQKTIVSNQSLLYSNATTENISNTTLESKFFTLESNNFANIRYYQKNNFYYEFNPSVNLRKDFINDESDFNFGNITLIPGIGIGYGRLEIVNNAWLAQTIFRNLDAIGIIDKDLNENDLLSLSERITNIQNTRIKDGRLENIYEFQNLSQHILDNQWYEGDLSLFHAILFDTYRFENFRIRSTGTRFNLRYEPVFRRNFNNSGNRFSHSFQLNITKNKVISRLWQFDWTLNFTYILTNGLSLRNKFLFNANVMLGYYPNARTNFRFIVNSAINEFDNILPDGFNMSCQFLGDYYISPELRFEANIVFDYLGENIYSLKYKFGVLYFLR